MNVESRIDIDSQKAYSAVAPFIDGVLSLSDSAAHEVINPSNGRMCVSIPVGNDADVERAVASCRRAFEDGRWSEAPPSFRKKTLHRFADCLLPDGLIVASAGT